MTDIEDRVNNYVGGMNKSIDEMKNGKNNVHMPALDTDAVGLDHALETNY